MKFSYNAENCNPSQPSRSMSWISAVQHWRTPGGKLSSYLYTDIQRNALYIISHFSIKCCAEFVLFVEIQFVSTESKSLRRLPRYSQPTICNCGLLKVWALPRMKIAGQMQRLTFSYLIKTKRWNILIFVSLTQARHWLSDWRLRICAPRMIDTSFAGEKLGILIMESTSPDILDLKPIMKLLEKL